MKEYLEQKMNSSIVYFLLICGFILGFIAAVLIPELKVLIHYWTAP